MDDSLFFLPDFNEKDDFVADILFMIDTFGSMTDEEITAAYRARNHRYQAKNSVWLPGLTV